MNVALAWTLRVVGAITALAAALRLGEEAIGWHVRWSTRTRGPVR